MGQGQSTIDMFDYIKSGNELGVKRLVMADRSLLDTRERSAHLGPKSPPLVWAARHGAVEVMKTLLHLGAKREERDGDGCTALNIAAKWCQPGAVMFLLNAGADPRAQGGWYNRIALHEVAWKGLAECVGPLVEAGGEVDARDSENFTPLHVAAWHGRVEVARELLANGAYPSLVNNNGETAQAIATKKGHQDIVTLLTTACKKRAAAPHANNLGVGANLTKTGLAIYYNKYNQPLKLQDPKVIQEDTKSFVALTKQLGYKFHYEDDIGEECFSNHKNLVTGVEKYLKGEKARKSHVFLIYYHGHGAEVLGHQCIVDNRGDYIPIYELVKRVYRQVKPQVIYLIMDCCSDYTKPTEEAKARVEAALELEDKADFEDVLVNIRASKSGTKTNAKRGKTFTSLALVPVLKEVAEKRQSHPNKDLVTELNMLYPPTCLVTPGPNVKDRPFPL